MTQRKLSQKTQETLGGTHRSHDTLAGAQEALQRALGAAQPGREGEWSGRVAATLDRVREALEQHRDHVQEPEGLYWEIEQEAPWLSPRLDQCRRQMSRLVTEATDLCVEVDLIRRGALSGLSAIRPDAEHLLQSLRDLQAKENDLIFESFRDLPAGD